MAIDDAQQQLVIEFDAVRDKTVEQLKIMNTVIFPIRYPEKIYQDCLACGELSQFAYHNDVAIGSVACRTEKLPSGGARLYILTLGVLAPYRGMGVGTRLLHRVIKLASADPNIKEATLHVQVGNEDALRFYSKAGFEVVETVLGFYKRLEPPDALLLRKPLTQP